MHSGNAIGCKIKNADNDIPDQSIVYNYEISNSINNFPQVEELQESNAITVLREDALQLFPNPTSGALRVQIKQSKLKGNVSITIYDLLGKVLTNQKVESAMGESFTSDLNISELAEGSYLIRVFDENGTSYEGKVVLQKD